MLQYESNGEELRARSLSLEGKSVVMVTRGNKLLMVCPVSNRETLEAKQEVQKRMRAFLSPFRNIVVFSPLCYAQPMKNSSEVVHSVWLHTWWQGDCVCRYCTSSRNQTFISND